MKTQTVLQMIIASCFLLFSVSVVSGDLGCYGYQSTTSHFDCNVAPANAGNCVWWAASKRPDLAAAISGSGWKRASKSAIAEI